MKEFIVLFRVEFRGVIGRGIIKVLYDDSGTGRHHDDVDDLVLCKGECQAIPS